MHQILCLHFFVTVIIFIVRHQFSTYDIFDVFDSANNINNTTELVWRPLQTKFGQGRLTIKNKNKNYYVDKTF